MDGAGTIYLADRGSNGLRKVDTAGIINRVPVISSPGGMTVDSMGIVFISNLNGVSLTMGAKPWWS